MQEDGLDAFINSFPQVQADVLRLHDNLLQMAGTTSPTDTQLLVMPELIAIRATHRAALHWFLSYQRELGERALALSIPEMFRRQRLHAPDSYLASTYQTMATSRIRHIISWVEMYFEPWLRAQNWEDLAAFDFPAMITTLAEYLAEAPPTLQADLFAGYQNRLQHLHDAVCEHETQRRLALALSQHARLGPGSQLHSLNDDLLRRIADCHPIFGSLVPWAILD
jgi:hypothetical protein